MSFVAEASILLDVPLEAAYDKLADHASWADWMPPTFYPAGSSRGPLRAGETVRMKIGRMPFASAIQVEIVERPHEITWGGGVPGVISARHRFLFEPEGEGTRVRSVETWEGPMERVLRPAIQPMAERIGRDQLQALDRALRG
jgi:hypothetical protein